MTNPKPNAETHRLRALAYLAKKDIPQARLESRKALELAPRWESTRSAAAMIDYLSALSPAALPDQIVAWPEPVDWALVKRDDESIALLRKAEAVFRELVEIPGKDRDTLQRYQVWRLACLANDPDRQDEANDYCREILSADKTHCLAMAWALARGFDVDLEPTVEALRGCVGSGSATIPQILALTHYYLAQQRPRDALDLLNNARLAFEAQNLSTLWSLWQARTLVSNGDPKGAIAVIEKSGSPRELQPARAMALSALARKTGDWQALTQELEKNYQETGEPNSLLGSCEIMAQQQNWQYVADHAERLIEVFATADAVRLAATGLHNAQRYAPCLKILNGKIGLFKGGRLPADLRRMRISCLAHLGSLSEAVLEAESVARENPTTEHLFALGQLYMEKGDLKALALVARQLQDRSDFPVEQELQVSWWVRLEDLRLAIALWRDAQRKGIADQMVGTALDLGFRLGLDMELRSLTERMMKLGQQGRADLRMVTIQDLAVFVEKERERLGELARAYENATVPIHMISHQTNQPLLHLYHRMLVDNEAVSDPLRQPCLLARHGGRALMSGFPESAPAWRLHMDVTSLLLAAHLEILPAVERAFKPLRISHDLLPALVDMKDKMSPHQPSRFEVYREIVRLIDEGHLAVESAGLPPDYTNKNLVAELGDDWAALFEMARARGGYVLAFLPPMKKDFSGPPSALPDDAGRYLLNCRSIAQALYRHGPLSEPEYRRSLDELGGEGRAEVAELLPSKGSQILCHANTPEVLADAGLLHLACDCFAVSIEKSEHDRIRASLRECERTSADVEWLDNLLNRLREGVENGTYEIIPAPATHARDEFEKLYANNPSLDCLRSLFLFESSDGDVIWLDDRCLNAFIHREGVPIVGINEVMKALVAAKALSPGEYYDKMRKLRAANVRFIPIETDEILHTLRQAQLDNGTLVETRALATLKRYIAACLLQGKTLQRPPMPERSPNPQGELAFLMGLGHALTDALAKLWLDQVESEDVCRARAEWFLENLYIERLAMARAASIQTPVQDDRYLFALTLAGLVSQAISFVPRRPNGNPSRRKEYFEWLYNRVLAKQLDADSALLPAVADVLKNSLRGAQEQADRDEHEGEAIPKGLTVWLLQQFCEDLPRRIQDELARDSEFMARIGFFTTVTVDGIPFDPDDYCRAGAEAINGREAQITPVGSNKQIVFQPATDFPGEFAFSFANPETGKRNVVAHDEWGLLRDSMAEREAVLRKNRHWFDCPQESFERVIAEVVSIENPRKRLEVAKAWRSASAAVYYADLHRKAQERYQFEFKDFLPPSADGLLRHHRLTPEAGCGLAFCGSLAACAVSLIREEGLRIAIGRLVGLPVALPEPILTAVADLSATERHDLIRHLARHAASPVSRIHFLRLLTCFMGDSPLFRRLARRTVVRLFNDAGKQDFRAFLAILKWVNEEFGYWSEARGWPANMKLAMVWSHAHRLMTAFVSIGVPTDWLQKTFDRPGQRIPREAFERDPDLWLDVANPRQINHAAFLFSGLASALGDEAEEVLDERTGSALAAEAFWRLSGKLFPALPLLKDVTQARNSLFSFLGSDRGQIMSSLFGAEAGGLFARSSLHDAVSVALDTLEKSGNDSRAWTQLHAVLGELPIYEDMADHLKTVLCGSSFVGLFEEDLQKGILALQLASSQAVNLADENLRCHVRSKLLEVARLLAGRELRERNRAAAEPDGGVEQHEAISLLLESALNLSVAARPSANVYAEFSGILTQLWDAWPVMVAVCRPMIQRLCEEIPVSYAQHFWPLFLQIRCG